tara:strand:+ start:249 stop:605 length:357 start_codon:yes stop_codon:yes gene_type:complete
MPVFSNNTCKAWCDINMTGTAVLNDDYGISSVTDHDTGDNSVAFDTAMSNANYAVAQMTENFEGNNNDSYCVSSGYKANRYTSSYRFRTLRLRFDTGNVPQFKDSDHASLAFFGDGGY